MSDHFTPVNRLDFDTFEECIAHATEVSSNLESGVVLLFLHDYGEIKLLPTHQTDYFLSDGTKLESYCLAWEDDDDAYCQSYVVHNCEWMKKYKLEDNYRLSIQYMPEVEGVSYQDNIDKVVTCYNKDAVPDCETKWRFMDE